MNGEVLSGTSPFRVGDRVRWVVIVARRSEEGEMRRPTRFEEHRWLGDKRTQVVYDVDAVRDESVIEELLASEKYLCFGPDTLAEARNRGYRFRDV